MNITDYLVAYLRQGNPVEIPNIGALVSQETASHFDPQTATYYPSQTVINIVLATGAEDAFVHYLAEKECVTSSTATQIWKNYCDALSAKLATEGKHQLNGLGVLVCDSNGYHFDMEAAATVAGALPQSGPINDVHRYTPTDAGDPFDAFEQPLQPMPVKSSSLMEGFSAVSETMSVPEPAEEEPISLEEGVRRARELYASGVRMKDAVKQVAKETGLPKNELYQLSVTKE